MESYHPDRICRTCLESKDELTSLYAEDVRTGSTLLEKLRFCASVQVAVSERVPMQACRQCVRCINEFYDFKQLCERSERTLLDLRDPLSCEDELPFADEIKREPFDATESAVGEFEFKSVSNNVDPVVGAKDEFPFADEIKREPSFDATESAVGEFEFRSVSNNDVPAKIKNEVKSKRTGTKDAERPKPYECETCGKRFVSRRNLKRHSLLHDKQTPDLCETSLTDSARNILSKCNNCGEEEVSLDDHKCLANNDDNIDTETRKPQYPCEQCGASFKSPFLLRQHMEKHSQGSNYICKTCGKAYKFERSLSVHIRDNHSAVKPVYECKVCSKRYNILHSYYKHIRLHKEELNEYECTVCKKQLKSKAQLDQHMRCHNKRHGCDVCGKLFRTAKNLALHKLCHARESVKPFACKLCSKRFSTAGNLWKHTKTFHNGKKNIKCDVCGMEFYNRFHYVAHYSKHTGVKPYQCDICGTGYNYKQNFMPHRRRCAAQREKSRNEEVEVIITPAS